MVFNIKLAEGFTRRARYCADGNKTYRPVSVTYITMLSR